MAVSIAELNSRVFLSLEPAAEFLNLDRIHNAVVQKLNIRTMQTRMSDINVLIGLSDEFTPTASPHDITALIGKGVPAWIEAKTIVPSGPDWWQQIRVVNLSEINNYQAMGALAAAFYGDETASSTAQPTQYVAFSYLPNAVCRIRFDRDGQRTDPDSDMILPDNLAELIVREAQNDLIPSIKMAMAFRKRNDDELAKIAPDLLAALNEVYMQNEKTIKDLDALWKVWAFRPRDVQTSFNKPTPSGANLYPGGRNNWNRYGGGY